MESVHITIKERVALVSFKSSDADLLAAVSQDGNQKAFSIIYDRYKSHAYSLAYTLLKNRALAEEVVQESMLQLWKISGRFNSEDFTSARNWILRIVARFSIDLKKARGRRRTLFERERVSLKPQTKLPEESKSETSEILVHVRALFAELTEDDRQLLTLYYFTGMTQLEIADMLSISQRTVSGKIKIILKNLRGKLSAMGVTASVTNLETQLQHLVCPSVPVPATLEKELFSRLDQGAEPSSSVNSSTITNANVLFIFIAFIGLTVLGSAFYSRMLNNQEDTPSSSEIETRATTLENNTPITDHAPLRKIVWNFDTPESSASLRFGSKKKFLSNGGWQDSGCVRFDRTQGQRSAIEIPLGRFKSPLRISYRSKLVNVGFGHTYKSDLLWKINIPVNATIIENFDLELIQRQHANVVWRRRNIVISENYVDEWVSDLKTGRMCRFKIWRIKRHGSTSFLLIIDGNMQLIIDDLSIEEINAKDVPDMSEFESAYTKNINRLVPEKEVSIPALRKHAKGANPITMQRHAP